jgi:hypothetical protein
MRCILVVADQAAADGILGLPGWRQRFAEVALTPLAEVARRYLAVLPVDHLSRPPLVTAATRVALLCTELAAFEQVVHFALPADILFMPSAVARLDLMAARRATLKAASGLTRGAIIATADLATETGGHGIGADFMDRVIGRRVMYDLPAGAPIDFGMLGEAGEGS